MPPRLPHPRRLLPLLLWTPGLIFLNTHVFSLHLVRGRSMHPTLSPHAPISHDLILVNRWSATDSLRRGQVVLFRSPTDPERVAIKRVVGIEGDVVKPRKLGTSEGVWEVEEGMGVRVPAGQVWVEGDEGVHSYDSNAYGAIPIGLITAKVMAVCWPPSRMGWVEDAEALTRRGAVVVRSRRESSVTRERHPGPATGGLGGM